MEKNAYLALENGTIFEGISFGATHTVIGELVFTTAMCGYMETLTDPSYYGQIITSTFPLIGNYGTMSDDMEGEKMQAFGYVVRHWCQEPSNFRSEGTLDTFLKHEQIPGISEIDTRALTKLLRTYGSMNAMITTNKEAIDLASIKAYRVQDAIDHVSTKRPQVFQPDGEYCVVVMDYGCKRNIVRELIKRKAKVVLMPQDACVEDILNVQPDGILFSNGPGDPSNNPKNIQTIQALMRLDIPLFGICLGHQMMALAAGFQTIKLSFGHHGVNQPVKDVCSGRTYMTSQNHGYAVCLESIDPTIANLWMINANDRTCEGIRYHKKPFFSVQFHPEGTCGPQDTNHLFDEFIKEVTTYATQSSN